MLSFDPILLPNLSARSLCLKMDRKLSRGACLICEALRDEIKGITPIPMPKDTPPPTNSDCSFASYINDGRGDLKDCGTVLSMV